MQYVCQLCGYIYDEDNESTAFSELPADWVCPLCKAPKSMFKPKEVPPTQDARANEADGNNGNNENETDVAQAPAHPVVGGIDRNSADSEQKGIDAYRAIDEDGEELVKLSAGQLAALCGNLARGCEKQARVRECELFDELADYFAAHVDPINNARIDELATLLLDDTTTRYAAARTCATEQGDRGALRVITWGERITNMLKYLTDRYISEGESFLADTNIWVCTVCGFIYVGNEAPELCPVCKVPAWKFELIEAPATSTTFKMRRA